MLIIIAILASVIAGVGTGLVGLSAATAITPLLVSCGVPVHQAIYVALFSDVIASAFTSREYAINKHMVKNNGKSKFPITFCVFMFTIIFTVIGAVVSYKIPESGVGGFAVFVSLFVGVKFIVEYIISRKKSKSNSKISSIKKIFNRFQTEANNIVIFIGTLIGGALIGLTSGFSGVGGGMTMLLVFRAFGYDLKDAVCVSTFTMIFVALIGGILHYTLGAGVDSNVVMDRRLLLCICAATTTISAWITSKLANKCGDKYHKLLCGILLLVALVITWIF